MKIVFGADHGGFELKESMKAHLAGKGFTVIDAGIHDTNAVDYPDIAKQAADLFFTEKADTLILACGTGIGISIAANKIKGIYCGLIYNEETARLAREHNDVNSLAFGGRQIAPGLANRMLDAFFGEKASTDERHERRRKKYKQLDAEGTR
ncbi:MAG: RpiB/LacA/LacB family sugar-phosphate isomerase [Spirochaetes bacterium]|nr:RpiB/LacA/LacB family sugar-phosphate isomerase [Spirochaetota bacterium]